MRITQTFWTANQSLLNNSFGWISPQAHLMSWALSCLSLRKNYDDVVLYTDSEGYRVFIELMKLPYTDVVVQYDDLHCPQLHWAYPKMLTYSLQKEPFIHVDGDLYIPNRLNANIENAGLIAQNVENGTKYYKSMMGDILQRQVVVPDFLHKELDRDSIRAYNAGVLGGNDVDFIQEYCRSAFQIIEANHLNDEGNSRIHVNNNLLYEQVLFFALADKYKKKVATVIEREIPDNGYYYQDFCDFYKYDQLPMLHILGGYKRNPRICNLLERTLLNKYPEYYKRIVELFTEDHKRLQSGYTDKCLPGLSVQMCMATYQDYLKNLLNAWKNIPVAELLEQERRTSSYPVFLYADEDQQLRFIMGRTPYVDIFEIPDEWPEEAKKLIKERIEGSSLLKLKDIVCFPTLLGNGYKELMINDIDYNILLLLETERTFADLYNSLIDSFSFNSKEQESYIRKLIMDELEKLSYNGLIYARLE